jgi:type II secretory pathway component PulF
MARRAAIPPASEVTQMKISLKSIARFTRQMATYQDSFVDIRKAINSMAEGSADFRLSSSLRRVGERVKEGDSLFEAFSKEGDRYPLIFLRMTKVGEESGTLAVIYTQLADYFDQQVSMRRKFIARLIYPAFMFAAFASSAASYNAIERMFLQNLLRDSSIVALVLAAFIVLRLLLVGRSITDFLVLFIPGLRGPFRKLMLSRFSLSMYLMTGSAIGMPEAVRESGKSSNNAFASMLLDKAADRIEDGTPLTPALDGTHLFPRDFIDIVEVAEESGTISESLRRVSRHYAEDAEMAFNRLVSGIAWGIYLFVAGLMAYYIITLYAQYVGKITSEMGKY